MAEDTKEIILVLGIGLMVIALFIGAVSAISFYSYKVTVECRMLALDKNLDMPSALLICQDK